MSALHLETSVMTLLIMAFYLLSVYSTTLQPVVTQSFSISCFHCRTSDFSFCSHFVLKTSAEGPQSLCPKSVCSICLHEIKSAML